MTRSGQAVQCGVGNSVDQGIMPEKEEGERPLARVHSLGANDANLPCKSRHISRHRAAEGRVRARSERSGTRSRPFVSSHSSPPLPCTILQIRRRWMKSFPSCYPRELSRRPSATSRKFHDVNAIARRADRRTNFAYLRNYLTSSEFISHHLANCCAEICQFRREFYQACARY